MSLSKYTHGSTPALGKFCWSLRTKQYILTVILTFTLSTLFAQTGCTKCEIEKVKIVSEHLDNLTSQMIEDFLCTFDTSCFTNAEYSEWSNEVLYNVLDNDPSLLLKVLTNSQVRNIQLLMTEIENPIHEFDYQEIYDKVKDTKTKDELTNRILTALKIAAEKEGKEIKR